MNLSLRYAMFALLFCVALSRFASAQEQGPPGSPPPRDGTEVKIVPEKSADESEKTSAETETTETETETPAPKKEANTTTKPPSKEVPLPEDTKPQVEMVPEPERAERPPEMPETPVMPQTNPYEMSNPQIPSFKAIPEITEEILQQTKPDDDDELTAMTIIAKRITKLMEDTESWEKSEPDDSSMGAFKRVQSRAERFSIERQTRKKLEQEVQLLLELVDAMVQERTKAESRARQIRRWAKQIAELQRKRARTYKSSTVPMMPKTKNEPEEKKEFVPENFEFYTVQKSRTLKEISALPEVYGDENKWMLLLNANRDADPHGKLEIGRRLVVPRLRPSRDFDF